MLDFGIAKRGGETDPNEQKLTQQGMVLGTPPYMSPEQFTGQPIDQRSDIYALGVMAYEMLTGKLPWTAETPWEWATQHMTVQPYPVDQLPEAANAPDAMRAAIMKAMAKTPEERFESVKAFYESFSQGGKMAGGTAQMAAPSHVTIQTGAEPVSMRGATQAIPTPPPMPAPPMPQGAPPVQPTPQPMQAMPPGGAPPMMAAQAAPSGGGGGGGKMIAIALVGLLVVGGGATGLYFAFGQKAPPPSGAGDAGIAANAGADAGTPTDDDAGALAPLAVDAGKDAGRPLVLDAGFRPVLDAGKAPVPTPSTTCHWIPACSQAKTMRGVGQTKQADKLAADCRAAGCVPE